MKVIVNDKSLRHGKGKGLKKVAINENIDYDEEDDFMGDVGGKYDFIMMVGDGSVYGFEGEKIYFSPVGDLRKPIGFQWTPALNREVDFNWLPLDDEYEYDETVNSRSGRSSPAMAATRFAKRICWPECPYCATSALQSSHVQKNLLSFIVRS